MVNTFHPLFVHFPIALLILAGIAALTDTIKSSSQLRKVVVWNLLAATLGAGLAVIVGLRDASVIPHNETIHEIMELHEKMGFIVFIFSLCLSLWFLTRYQHMKKIENIFFIVALWVSITLIGYTGYLGGKMVYDNGAGIKPMQETFHSEGHDHKHDHKFTKDVH
jgi:uncharacterized membrane protein